MTPSIRIAVLCALFGAAACSKAASSRRDEASGSHDPSEHPERHDPAPSPPVDALVHTWKVTGHSVTLALEPNAQASVIRAYFDDRALTLADGIATSADDEHAFVASPDNQSVVLMTRSLEARTSEVGALFAFDYRRITWDAVQGVPVAIDRWTCRESEMDCDSAPATKAWVDTVSFPRNTPASDERTDHADGRLDRPLPPRMPADPIDVAFLQELVQEQLPRLIDPTHPAVLIYGDLSLPARCSIEPEFQYEVRSIFPWEPRDDTWHKPKTTVALSCENGTSRLCRATIPGDGGESPTYAYVLFALNDGTLTLQGVLSSSHTVADAATRILRARQTCGRADALQ